MALPPVFCELILAFIKAFCLRGDLNALKQAALSISMLVSAKKALWECCKDDLSVLDLPFTQRRSSEKHSQAQLIWKISYLPFRSLTRLTRFHQSIVRP